MIPRYTRPEMGQIWADENRLQIWLEIELQACEAMAAVGLVPLAVAERLRQRSWRIIAEDVVEVQQIEEQTQHDVIAFLTHLERRLGPEARYLHLGMTSSDVLDTTFGVQLSQAGSLLLRELDQLRASVRQQALRHQRTVMIGRTHGMHAEPTTFGLVLAIWFEELGRQRERIEMARTRVAVGKLSGAVGTFAHLPLSVEERVCRNLGLTPEPVSNQVVQRDRHAEFFCQIANLGATLEKMAINIRHFQRTEVGEAAEPFAPGQRGSSAMPHKRNPIGCENLTGVARLLRSYASAALENVALWHERDISHSAVERVIAPDATILADYAVARMNRIIEGLRANPERMRANLELSGGLVFSESVLLALVKAGIERQSAYGLVQRAALAALERKEKFENALASDPEVVRLLGEDGLARCFDLEPVLGRVDEVFQRVFGERQDGNRKDLHPA